MQFLGNKSSLDGHTGSMDVLNLYCTDETFFLESGIGSPARWNTNLKTGRKPRCSMRWSGLPC